MKKGSIFFFLILVSCSIYGQSDSLKQQSWIRDKISFGRSQHIQYFTNNRNYKTNTLFNKAYYTTFSPIQFKGFRPFVSLTYEYFITQAVCYTCYTTTNNYSIKKQLHYLNFATVGLGFIQEIKFTNKKGKELELIFGAALERFLFKRSFIFKSNGSVEKAIPFISNHQFFNHYFFKDVLGFRVYNANTYKVFIQLSGLLLRNERLHYAPSRYTFHNFMLGFNVFLK
jgi:hypothetical protein